MIDEEKQNEASKVNLEDLDARDRVGGGAGARNHLPRAVNDASGDISSVNNLLDQFQ